MTAPDEPPEGHPALVATIAVLDRHSLDDDGVCRCGADGWGPGYHHEHVAVQLAIAGVLKAPS